MANIDKDIVITPNRGQTADPKIVFSGANASTAAQNITLTALPQNGGTLSFEGSAGQLFSISNSMSGTIYRVNDISGIPSIEVLDTGLIRLAEYTGNVLLGYRNDSGLYKLDVNGETRINGIRVGRGAGNIATNATVGANSLIANTTGSNNTAVGESSLRTSTTGSNNTAFGVNSLYSTTTGTNNSAFGYNAGNAITTGTKNSVLGSYSGNQGGLDIRTTSNNIVLSDGDGNPRLHINPTGKIAIGEWNATPISAAYGGTGSTTIQGSMNVLAGAATNGYYLRGNGTNVIMSAIPAGDIPALDASKITTGTIDPARLPSYVDDVLEFANLAAFPATGETGKIYVAIDTNKTYRWSGSSYVYITSGAVDSVAGKTGVVTLVKADVGLSNVDNTSDAAKPVSTAQLAALNLKAPLTGVGTTGTWPISITGVSAKTSTFVIADTRAVASVPNAVASGTGLFEFKNVTSVDNPPYPANVAYAHVMTTNGWTADGTGGWPSQLSFGSKLSFRQGTSATTWGTWNYLLDSSLTSAVGLSVLGASTAAVARTSLGLGNVEDKSSTTIRSEITGSNVTTALGFTPYNSTNPAGYTTNLGTVTGVIAGTGISVSATGGNFTVTNTGLVGITDDTSSSSVHYPTLSTSTSGAVSAAVTSSSKLSFKPSTGALSVEKLISTGTYAATTDTKPNLHIDNLGNITRVEKEETNLYDISTYLVSGIYNLTLADRDRILYCEGGIPFEIVVPDAMPDGFTFYVFAGVLDCFVTTTSPEYFIGAGGLEFQATLLVEPYCINVYKNFGSSLGGVWYAYTQNSSTNRQLNYANPTFDPLVDDDIFLVKIGGPTTIDGARSTTFGEMKSGMEGTFAKGSNSGTTTTIGTATTDIVTTTGQLVAEGSYANTADLRANLAIDALGNIKRITKENFALKDISASVVLNAYEVQPADRDTILVGPFGDSVDYTLPATLPDGFSVSFFSFASGTVTPVNTSESVVEAGVQIAASGRLEPFTIKTFLKVANEPDSIWYGYALGSSPANSIHYSSASPTLSGADYIAATDADGMSRNKITVADLTAQMTASINMPVLAGAAPTSGVQLFGSSIAGREIPAFRGTTGLATTVQSSLMRNKLSRWAPVGNGVSFGLDGVVALTATGTATASNVAATNRYTWQKRVEYLVTTAATTAVAGWSYTETMWGRGANAGDGGFFMVCRFGIATGTSVSTRRCFVGLRNSVAAPTDVNPSTQVNCIGVGYDAADAQLQIMHNDASGACTKIALGAFFPRPSTDRTSCYELALYCAPAGTTVGYEVTDLVTGAVANGTLSTDLPATTTLLAPLGYSSVGGTSGVTGITLMSLGIETDY